MAWGFLSVIDDFDCAYVEFDAGAVVGFGVPAAGGVVLRGVRALVALGAGVDDAGCFYRQCRCFTSFSMTAWGVREVSMAMWGQYDRVGFSTTSWGHLDSR